MSSKFCCFYLATVTVVARVSIHESAHRKYDRCFETTWGGERSPCCDPRWSRKFRNLGRKSNFLETSEEFVSCLVDVPYVRHLEPITKLCKGLLHFSFYRQLGCLAFSLRLWSKIKQFLSNCPKQVIFA